MWWREEVFRRVLRNTSVLGLGKTLGGLLHLASLALSARLLGPAAFGTLVLVRSYAQSAGGLAKFQSWQTLIHFGAARADANDREGFRDLAAFTITADAATGLFAAILAAALAPLITPALGMGGDARSLAQLYCLVIPLTASATPTGVLRIFNRFHQLSSQSVLTPSVRLIGIGAAALAGSPLWMMVAAWLASDVIGELYLWLQGWRELKRRGFADGSAWSLQRAIAKNKGLLGFSLAANVSATLSVSLPALFMLLVGALLGSVAAGLFRIAQVVLDAVATPAELAMRSFFPEVTRLRERDHRYFRTLIIKAVTLASAWGLLLTVVIALCGPAILVAAMGEAYADAGTLLRIVALGFVPVLAIFPVETALLALGSAGSVLLARAIAGAISLGAALLLASRLGLPGVGVATVLGSFTAFAAMLAATRLKGGWTLTNNQKRCI